MAYRFNNPMAGAPEIINPYQTSLASPILRALQIREQQRRLAQERLLADEQARQFGVEDARRKAIEKARQARHEENLGVKRRNAAVGEGTLDLSRRQLGMDIYKQKTAEERALHPERAAEVSAFGLGVPGMPEHLVAPARQRMQDRQVATDPNIQDGTLLDPWAAERGQYEPKLGEATPEFGQGLTDLTMRFKEELQSDDPDRQAAAAAVLPQLEGYLRSEGGVVTKASKAAQDAFNQVVTEKGKDRRAEANRQAALARQQQKPYSSEEPERGRKAGVDILNRTGAFEGMEDWKAINGAIAVLEEAKRTRNPTVLNSTALLTIQAMTEQKGRALSNQDFNLAQGESLMQKLRTMMNQKVLGQADIDKVDRYIEALRAGMVRVEGKLDTAVAAIDANLEAMGEIAPNTPYHRAMESARAYMLPYLQSREEQKKEEEKAAYYMGSAPAQQEPPAPDDGYDRMGLPNLAPSGATPKVNDWGGDGWRE